MNLNFGKHDPLDHERALAWAEELGLSSRFQAWLKDNPEIWHQFCSLADMTRAKGRANWSARAILHVLRWVTFVRESADPTFKINNNWSPGMARLYNSLRGVKFFRDRTVSGVYA